MSVSKSRVLLVIFGWLLLCSTQPPQEQTHGGNRTQQATPATQLTSTPTPTVSVEPSPKFTPYPGYNPDPCYEAKDHDAADLCAQWRAAVAAEKTAHEARRATVWAIVATILSGLSFFAVALALIQTVRFNRSARRIGEAQVRCYLSAKEVKLRFDDTGQPMISLIVANSGQSPALNFRWTFSTDITNIVDGWDWASEPGRQSAVRDIPAQGEESFAATIPNGQPMPQGQLSDLLLSPNLHIKVQIITAWTDVFENGSNKTWRFEAMLPAGLDIGMALFPDTTVIEKAEKPGGNGKKWKHISDIFLLMSGGRGLLRVRDS